MNFIASTRRSAWPAVVAMALLMGGTALGARADEASDWTAITALRKQIGDDTFRNQPAEAAAQLQKFYGSRQLDPVLAAEVVLQVAEITDVQLNKPDDALKRLFQWGRAARL